MRLHSTCIGGLLSASLASSATAQTALTWTDVLVRYKANNPTLRAGEIGVEESRAGETTAKLRPNPDLSLSVDGVGLDTPAGTGHFDSVTTVASVDYLIELRHKRQLRLASAQGATAIAVSTQADLERNQRLLLRTAFVQLLQAKAFLELARSELSDYDQVIAVGRERLETGDIARIDLDRLELQRVQYESDVQTASVNVRTAKIQLLQLMNDKTPVDGLDITGRYDFAPLGRPLEELRATALDTRPDLKAAMRALEKAQTDYKLAVANASTDPVLGLDVGRTRSPGNPTYLGVSVSIPLRVFDRNQGEKLRTRLDIERSERLAEAVRVQVTSDVATAYATVQSAVALLQPYRERYLESATRVRDTLRFSYERGGAALVDFLQAQQDYRTVRITYVNLIAAYLTAVAQLNFAMGSEVVS